MQGKIQPDRLCVKTLIVSFKFFYETSPFL
jgi:hypothetical protein